MSIIFQLREQCISKILCSIPKLREAAAYIGASGHLWPPIGPQKTI